ncbi:hypothetical protein [Streptomyces filamentosus]|uniref:hypothetical protein n=1 Tax=Streptomyces filamentosus TaxID=67294 RepID=UPI0033F44289
MSRTAEALRAAAFACAAVALALCLVNDRADGPRWDVLALLLAAAACTGAWAFGTRGERVPQPAPGPFPGLPSVLPRNRVDWYAVVWTLLAAVAPFAAFRFATWGEASEVLAILGCLALIFWGLVFLPRLWGLLVRPLHERYRLLARDAKAGRVHAVRFELESAEWGRIIDEDNPKLIDPKPTHIQMLKLRDDKGDYYGTQPVHPGIVGQSPIGQYSHFAARFKGRHVWVMWPERWQPILAAARRGGFLAYPVAVVSESGEMVWSHSAISWSDRYLTDPATLQPTVPGLRARPVRPRPVFLAPVHVPVFVRLGVALAALAPLLLDLVPGTASVLLGLLATAALIDAPFAAHRANGTSPDPTRWTVLPVQDMRLTDG